jgi:hypothetical protein
MAALVIGLSMCGAWSLGAVRLALLRSNADEPSTRRRAIDDPSPEVAAAACSETLARDDRASTITRVVNALPTPALRKCLQPLELADMGFAGRQVVRRFERSLVGSDGDGLSCEDVTLLAELPASSTERIPALWSCVAQTENTPIRTCCAATLRDLAGESTPTGQLLTEGIPAPVAAVQWLLAATLHGAGRDDERTALTEQLSLSAPAGLHDVALLACGASFSPPTHDIIRHVRASVDASCPQISDDGARSISNADWFATCGSLQSDESAQLCPSMAAHPMRVALEVASGQVGAAVAAYRYGSYSGGINTGHLAEQRRAAETTERILAIEERVSRSEEGSARGQSIDSLRGLRDEVEREQRTDGYLRGFAPVRN